MGFRLFGVAPFQTPPAGRISKFEVQTETLGGNGSCSVFLHRLETRHLGDMLG